MHIATPLLALSALASSALASADHQWTARSEHGLGAVEQPGLMARMGGMARKVRRASLGERGEAALLVVAPAANDTTIKQNLAASNTTKSTVGAVQNTTGTYFILDTTSLTACNTYATKGQYIVAINTKVWNDWNGIPNADVCGKEIIVTNTATNTSVTGTVWDNSAQAEWTSLSLEMYLATGANEDVGEFPMTYYFTNATGTGTLASDLTISNTTAAVSGTSLASVPKTGATSKIAAALLTATSTSSAPTTSYTPTTTSSYDWASASSVSQAAADAAWASASSASQVAAEAWAAQSSKSAEAAWAAESSKSAAAAWAAESSKSAAAAWAAESSKSAAAAWAAESASSASAAKASAKANSASSSSSSSWQYSGGIATYFLQNGVAGACGTVHKDTDYVAALYTSVYANGANCGRKILLTSSSGSSVTVTVADECPTCGGSQDVDLSESAFLQLGTIDQGVVTMSWKYLD